jgi:hypothetical protein
MSTIYKYVLSQPYQGVSMPNGAEILSVQLQGENVCLWAKVNPSEPMRIRNIWMFGTGHPLPEMTNLVFIGTVQVGQLVWHFFEEPSL